MLDMPDVGKLKDMKVDVAILDLQWRGESWCARAIVGEAPILACDEVMMESYTGGLKLTLMHLYQSPYKSLY